MNIKNHLRVFLLNENLLPIIYFFTRNNTGIPLNISSVIYEPKRRIGWLTPYTITFVHPINDLINHSLNNDFHVYSLRIEYKFLLILEFPTCFFREIPERTSQADYQLNYFTFLKSGIFSLFY